MIDFNPPSRDVSRETRVATAKFKVWRGSSAAALDPVTPDVELPSTGIEVRSPAGLDCRFGPHPLTGETTSAWLRDPFRFVSGAGRHPRPCSACDEMVVRP